MKPKLVSFGSQRRDPFRINRTVKLDLLIPAARIFVNRLQALLNIMDYRSGRTLVWSRLVDKAGHVADIGAEEFVMPDLVAHCGETAPVSLRMETSPGKALSMALNLAVHRDFRFNVTGSVTCRTPYGWILIPLNLEEALE